jgi:flagellar secretion chaperone FliS
MASTYRRVGVESNVASASPHGLIVMLFDAVLETLSLTKAHMECGNIQAKGDAVRKATRLITEGLKASLDSKGGQLAENLGMLYDYSVAQLMQAHLKNDPVLVDEVINLIKPIADSWKSMDQTQIQ